MSVSFGMHTSSSKHQFSKNICIWHLCIYSFMLIKPMLQEYLMISNYIRVEMMMHLTTWNLTYSKSTNLQFLKWKIISLILFNKVMNPLWKYVLVTPKILKKLVCKLIRRRLTSANVTVSFDRHGIGIAAAHTKAVHAVSLRLGDVILPW